MIKKFKIFSSLFVILLLCQCGSIQYKKSILDYRDQALLEHLEDDRSPIKEDNQSFISYFDINKDFVLDCECKKLNNGEVLDVPTYSGQVKQFQKFAKLSCVKDSKAFSLYVYQNMKLRAMPEYANYLFLPFMDTTNGEESYGGGRYIDIMKQDLKNSSFSLDFNKAYNPWCAYSDGFNCPIPPLENHLEFAVTAGEAYFKGEKKKAH